MFRCERAKISAESGIELQRGFRGGEEASEFDGRGVAGVIAARIKSGDAVGDG